MWCWKYEGDVRLLTTILQFANKISITNFWNGIADFETNEIKNDSNNPILANARQGARMEAYVKLFELNLTLQPENKIQ